MIARTSQSPFDFLPQMPQRQLREIRSQTVGVMQHGLVALAMFSVSAVAGVVAGVVVGVLG